MLSITRMSMSPFGRILAVACTLPLVKYFGDDQAAWIKTMSIWAFLALLLLLFCFYKCEEKVVIKAREKQGNVPVKPSFPRFFVTSTSGPAPSCGPRKACTIPW